MSCKSRKSYVYLLRRQKRAFLVSFSRWSDDVRVEGGPTGNLSGVWHNNMITEGVVGMALIDNGGFE